MGRWAYRRALSALLSVASATLLLAGLSATLFNVAHASETALEVLRDSRGSAAAAAVAGDILERAGAPADTAAAAGAGVVTNPAALAALERGRLSGDGPTLAADLFTALAPVDETLASSAAAQVSRIATAPQQSLLSRSPMVWAITNADVLVRSGLVLTLVGLSVLIAWPNRTRATLRSVGRWAATLGLLWLALIVVAPQAVLVAVDQPQAVLVALTVQHLLAPWTLPLAALTAAGVAGILLARARVTPASMLVPPLRGTRLPGRPVSTASPAHRGASVSAVEPSQLAVGTATSPTPRAAVGSELFDPSMGHGPV